MTSNCFDETQIRHTSRMFQWLHETEVVSFGCVVDGESCAFLLTVRYETDLESVPAGADSSRRPDEVTVLSSQDHGRGDVIIVHLQVVVLACRI